MKDFIKTVLASALGFLLGSFMLMGLVIFSVIVITGVLLATGASRELSTSTIEDKSVIFLNIEGGIEERKTAGDVVREIVYDEKPKNVALFELGQALERAAEDKKIKGLYLRLRWTDAGWAKLESLRKLLKDFKKSGKFIYAYSEAYDERLYYLASIADQIFMYPKGEFEWNGVAVQSMFFKKTLGKLEVVPELIRAGRFKSAGEMITQEKMSDENRYQITELSDSLWKTVISEIIEDRPTVSAGDLDQIAKDISVSNAQQAFNMKLVDQLLPIEEVEQKMLQATGLDADDDVRLVAWMGYHGVHKKSSFMKSKKKIAVIVAEGEIQMGSGSSNGTIYSDELSGLIRDLNKEDDVKAVVLRVNSPGGSALASDVIWRSLGFLKKNKKVVTSFSDIAASGGYYIAAGSDYIFAEPLTITGSIGVFGVVFNAKNFFDNKLGITFDTVKTHPSADMMSNARGLSDFERSRIQADVNDIYNTFLNVVTEGRPSFDSIEAVKEVAEGRVWSGVAAKEIGLVDGLGSLNDAIKKAAELSQLKDYEVVVYPDEKRFIDKIFDSLGDVFTLPAWMNRLISKHGSSEIIYTRLPFTIEID